MVFLRLGSGQVRWKLATRWRRVFDLTGMRTFDLPPPALRAIVALDVLPHDRTVRAFTKEGVTVFSEAEIFAIDALPWLRFPVSEAFANLHRELSWAPNTTTALVGLVRVFTA